MACASLSLALSSVPAVEIPGTGVRIVRPRMLAFSLVHVAQHVALFLAWFAYLRRVTVAARSADEVVRRTQLAASSTARVVAAVGFMTWSIGILHRALD
jgi:hypothetical protein